MLARPKNQAEEGRVPPPPGWREWEEGVFLEPRVQGPGELGPQQLCPVGASVLEERRPLPGELPGQKVRGEVPWFLASPIRSLCDSVSSWLDPSRSWLPGESLKLSLQRLALLCFLDLNLGRVSK